MCCEDDRHTIRYTSMEKHGHVIAPLMAKGKAVGVFYYYVPCGLRLQPGQRDTFVAIGQQLGLAIENARLYEETRQLSLHDTLTGLGDRRLMELVLERDLPNVHRYGRALSVVMLDVDHFKCFNDEYGHPAGDRLLAELGAIVRRESRENDLPSRYGGEEFLVILPETDARGAARFAERLRVAVAASTRVTISLGVAQQRSPEPHAGRGRGAVPGQGRRTQPRSGRELSLPTTIACIGNGARCATLVWTDASVRTHLTAHGMRARTGPSTAAAGMTGRCAPRW